MRKLTIIAALAASTGVGVARRADHRLIPATFDGEPVTLHFGGAAQARVPLHIVGTTGVLVPLQIVRDGQVVVDQMARLDRSAVQLTTCSFDRLDFQGDPLPPGRHRIPTPPASRGPERRR